jgi:hypothetical protein
VVESESVLKESEGKNTTRIGKGNRFGSRNDDEKRLPQPVRALRLSGYKQVKTAIERIILAWLGWDISKSTICPNGTDLRFDEAYTNWKEESVNLI